MDDFIDFSKHTVDDHGRVSLLNKKDRSISAVLPYGWHSNCTILDESNGRRHIGTMHISEFRYSEWSPITKEEDSQVKATLTEVWDIRRNQKLEYLINRK